MKISFFLKGEEFSTLGLRAQHFAKKLNGKWICPQGENWKGKWKFILTTIKSKNHIHYIIDVVKLTTITLIISKILGKKIIIDTGDLVYELAKLLGGRNFFSLFLIKYGEKLCLKLADIIIVRGIYHQKLLKKKGFTNVYFLPDGVDLKIIKPTQNPTLQQKFNPQNYFTIGIIGTSIWSEKLQMCVGWEIVETIKLLQNLPIKGIIIGYGTGIEKLKKLTQKYHLQDKIIFIPKIPYHQLPDYLSLINVTISTQTNNPVGWVRTTSKLPLYLALNKYTLSTKVGTAYYLLPKEMLIPYQGIKDNTYPLKLAQKIKTLYKNPPSPNLLPLAHKYFSYHTLSHKLKTILTLHYPSLP